MLLLFPGIFSYGPQAHLLRGVVEQNVIFHVMDYALCLSESKRSICRKEGLIDRRNSGVSLVKTRGTLTFSFLLVVSVLIGYLVNSV